MKIGGCFFVDLMKNMGFPTWVPSSQRAKLVQHNQCLPPHFEFTSGTL